MKRGRKAGSPYVCGPGYEMIANDEIAALAPPGVTATGNRVRVMRRHVFTALPSPYPASGTLAKGVLRQWYDRVLAVVRPRQLAKVLWAKAIEGDCAAASTYLRHFGKNGTAGPAPQQARKKGGLDAELAAFNARGGDGAGGAGADAQVSVVAGQGEATEAALKQSTGG